MELAMFSPTVSEKYKNMDDDLESSLMTSSSKSHTFKKKSGSKGKSNTSKSYDEGDFEQKWDVQIKRGQEFFISGNLFTENVKFFSGIESQVSEASPIKSESSFSNENVKILTSYSPPQLLNFQIELSEKESCVIFDRGFTNSFEQINGNNKYLEGFYKTRNRKIKKRHINLMQRRLLAADDKKWLNYCGNVECSDNTVTASSVRLDKNKEIIANYKPPVLTEKCTEVVVIQANILEIHLQLLKFTSHPLFSTEHILAEKLCNLYNQYTSFIKGNNVGRIRTQLEALRYFRTNLINKKGAKGYGLTQIKKVNRDIQKVRKMYFEEGKKERDNLKDILNTWKEIKNIREKQKFSSTNIKLSIKKEKVDYEADSLRYNTEFDETFQEMIKETKIDLQEKPKVLKNKNGSTDEDTDDFSGDFDIDEANIKQYLENIFHQSFRQPGEPILKLSLSNNHETTKEIEHKKEVVRRNNVRSTKLYLNILCDKAAVCKSKPLELNDSFLLYLKETFSIQLEHIPKCLTIEIIEESHFIKKKIGEIVLTIPTQNFFSAHNKSLKSTFGKNEIVCNKPMRTGKDATSKIETHSKDKKSTPDVASKLTPEGYIEYYINWQKSPLRKKDVLKEQIKLLKDTIKKDFTVNVNKLSEWMVQSVPDPQDPRNVVFFEYMANNDLQLINNNNFRLSPIAKSLEFCKILDIEKNVRFKIIQLRNQNETEFDGIVVPNRIKEIPNNIIDISRKRKLMGNKYLCQEDAECETEDQINNGRKYLKQIHEKLFQICKNYENNLTYESVVDEKYLTHFEVVVKTSLRNFFNWFSWQSERPLLSAANVARKSLDHQKMSKQCHIIIKIVSGKNIPKRKNSSKKPTLSETDSSKTEYNTNETKPFVEISYNNISIRTSTSNGINPIWNDTLTFPLECQNCDYLNSESLNGTITVNLYDECNMGKHPNKNSYNWLGAVEIPLSSVCYATSMSGLFKVKLAQLLFGYDIEKDEHPPKSPKINSSQCYSQYSYIQMELSITPNVPKLTMNMETLPCADLPYIKQHIIKWNKNFNNNFPHRQFWALAIDTSVKTVCITRYLKPLEPPQINLEEFDVTAEQCLRYVSLIPFTDSNQFFHNVWLTTNELLQFMIGSLTDHAVTLTCYLLALKMEAWLLLGYGIPHGSAAYVLVREYLRDNEMPTYYIYDVYYNEKYNLTDPYCPLKRIYCLANGENVWANTQRTDNVNITKFDLNKKSDWLPLFSSNISAPTHFVNSKVTYRSKIKTENLENQIETKIKNKISKLRQLDRTIWNYNLTSDLKNVLRSFEINSMYNRNNHETINELNKKFSSHTVNGYVLNFAYLNTATLVKKIKKIGIENQESNEFVLAVYIHTYTGPLTSVWILIGNVIKNIDI